MTVLTHIISGLNIIYDVSLYKMIAGTDSKIKFYSTTRKQTHRNTMINMVKLVLELHF